MDQRSDLFSFGVLLYEMLTLQSPCRSASAAETLRRVLVETPQPVSALRRDVPAEFDHLIARLLEKEPDHRPDSASEVVRALADIASRMPAEVTATEVATTSDESLSDVPTASYATDSPQVPAFDTPGNQGSRRAPAPPARHRRLAITLGFGVLMVIAVVLVAGH